LLTPGEWQDARVASGDIPSDGNEWGVTEWEGRWYWALYEGSSWRFGPFVGDWFADAVTAGWLGDPVTDADWA
jgi:hypothetical protein